MMILSQDKTEIINLDRITEVVASGINICIADRIEQENGYIIAAYKTEERAKEVLQEIVKKYSLYLELKGGPAILQGQTDIQPNIFNIPKVYEMPEE